MITRDCDEFVSYCRKLKPDFGPACAKAVFLVEPYGFGLSDQSAQDNRYMQMDQSTQTELALAQHRALANLISKMLPTTVFAGAKFTPDAVFPNNVFATVPNKLIIGKMRHPVRHREADHQELREYFRKELNSTEIDLRDQAGVCELTGSIVIDRSRGIGFCGLSERCDTQGAEAMHEAFGLRATLVFDLAPGEYHSNVLLSVFAGKVVALCPDGFADSRVVAAISKIYAPHVITLESDQRLAFAGNGICLDNRHVLLSKRAHDSLHSEQLKSLEGAGLSIRSCPLDEIEKAGGSLRCCVAEIY